MGKKALCLIFAFLLSINSFAAVVSDNDGSAFITKAEYDSLKNIFQSQLDSYNTGIDNKIDNAISSYLAGIKVDQPPMNLFETYKTTVGHNPNFYNVIPGIGSSTQTPAIFLSVNRSQAYDVYKYLIYNLNIYVSGAKGYENDAVLSFGNPPWSGSYSSWTMVWYKKSFVRTYGGSERASGNLDLYHSSPTGDKTSETRSASTYKSNSSNGEGSGWTFQDLGFGPSLKYYNTSLYINMEMNTDIHRYKNFASLSVGYYSGNNGKADDYAATIDLPRDLSFGYTEYGTKESGTSKTSSTYYDVTMSRYESRAPGNWLDRIVAKNTMENIYGIYEDQSAEADTSASTFKIEDITFTDVYYDGGGGHTQTNKLGSVTVNYYPQRYQMNQTRICDLAIPGLSSLISKKVCHGEGFPFAKALKDAEKININIKFSSTGGDVIYKISKNKLYDDGFVDVSDYIASGTTTSGERISCIVENVKKDDVL